MPRRNLTPGQRECWIEIAKFKNKRGYGPSITDLMQSMQSTSRSTVQSRISALLEHEIITRDPHIPRSIVLLVWPEEVPRRDALS